MRVDVPGSTAEHAHAGRPSRLTPIRFVLAFVPLLARPPQRAAT